MLDTIVLCLREGSFIIKEPQKFSPSADHVYSLPTHRLGRQGAKAICNPTNAQMLEHGYMPRLTLVKRLRSGGVDMHLRVEFSAPKMLYGNNFDELTDHDFLRLCEALSSRLYAMGVLIKDGAIRGADVAAIHFSKNLPLTDYTHCSMIIGELAKCAVTRRMDGTHTQYFNDGSALKYHASNHEIIVYDKLKDLAKAKVSDKRAVEADSIVQMDLLKSAWPKAFEVLRLELRIGTRQKLKQMLMRLKLPLNLDFESLFSEALAKAILMHYWQEITQDIPVLAASQFAPEELYQQLARDEPGAKPAKWLQKIGMLAIINRVGLSGLRVLMLNEANPRTWYRATKELKQMSVASNLRYAAIRTAQKHLQAFLPLNIKNYMVS